MYKIMDESILFFSGVFLLYQGMRWNVKSQFLAKQGALMSHFATGMSRKFQLLVNRKVRMYFLSCSDLAILTLQLPTCSTRVLDFGKSPLVSQSRDPVTSCLLMHTLDQFFTLSHTQPLHYSHLNTRFLNTELQKNLARNKANTQLNKFNFTQYLDISFAMLLTTHL